MSYSYGEDCHVSSGSSYLLQGEMQNSVLIILVCYIVLADSGKKPVVKTDMLRHVVLTGSNDSSYHRSEPEWIDYSLCTGYR